MTTMALGQTTAACQNTRWLTMPENIVLMTGTSRTCCRREKWNVRHANFVDCEVWGAVSFLLLWFSLFLFSSSHSFSFSLFRLSSFANVARRGISNYSMTLFVCCFFFDSSKQLSCSKCKKRRNPATRIIETAKLTYLYHYILYT